LSFLLRWLAFETTLLTLPVAGLSVVLLALLIIKRQQASWARSFWRRGLLLLAFASGMLWSLAQISDFMRSLPAPVNAVQNCLITATIEGLPRPSAQAQQLLLRVNKAEGEAGAAGCMVQVGQRIRVGDYSPTPPDYRGGQVWQFNLRLKPPHGSANPGGFDYERWLFSQRIVATGSVRGTPVPIAAVGKGFSAHLAAIRAQWRAKLLAVSQTQGVPDRGRGLLLGLTIGDSDFLSETDWETLLATGTNHLLAISGLHVGMVAGLFAWLAGGLWARTRWCEGLPARQIAAWVAVVAAWGYALVAGMSVPTERTALMITILLAGLLLGRPWRLFDLWLVALMGVLLLEPFSVLTAGFWLSFGAVLIMLVWLSARPNLTFWRDGLRLQIILTLALLPWAWWLFDRLAWSSLPANLLAVPLITFVITPLALLVMVFSVLFPAGAHAVMGLINLLSQGLFGVLAWLEQNVPQSQVASPPTWSIGLAVLGIAWLLMPRTWPARYVGLVLCLPAVVYRPQALAPGEARSWVLDVGQGMAVVIQTARHTVLYDTGPAFGMSDAGARTVLPALRALHVGRLDQIVISHAARDHAGGLPSVRAAFGAAPIISGQPLSDIATQPCVDGATWAWDGVRFSTYQAKLSGAAQRGDNNRSCVLRVQDAHGSLLLTGDLEAVAEQDLIRRHELTADWLYVPHHGSKTSSSPAFLAAVNPKMGLISAGALNPFGHPHPLVVARYQAAGIPLINTAGSGAIEVGAGQVQGYRARCWPFAWRI
jgi:competence protein ComEC